MNICPVCGYDGLRYPPRDFNICPSCYTEFGYEDSNRSYRELTREWIRNGMRWEAADVTPPPPDWETRKYAQLRNIDFFDYTDAAEDTSTTIEPVTQVRGVRIMLDEGAVSYTIRAFTGWAGLARGVTAGRA